MKKKKKKTEVKDKQSIGGANRVGWACKLGGTSRKWLTFVSYLALLFSFLVNDVSLRYPETQFPSFDKNKSMSSLPFAHQSTLSPSPLFLSRTRSLSPSLSLSLGSSDNSIYVATGCTCRHPRRCSISHASAHEEVEEAEEEEENAEMEKDEIEAEEEKRKKWKKESRS